MSSSKTDHSPIVSEFSYVVDVNSRSPSMQARSGMGNRTLFKCNGAGYGEAGKVVRSAHKQPAQLQWTFTLSVWIFFFFFSRSDVSPI